MRIALFQPDIPQNAGTLLRMGACLGVPVDVIEPAGFDLSDRALKRAGLDYLAHSDLKRHASFDAFDLWRRAEGRRLILATTKATASYWDLQYLKNDILIMGRESAGVPETVRQTCDAAVGIPMCPGQRSLNVAVAAAMITGEMLRQSRSA